MIELNGNGMSRNLDVPPDMLLLWALRDHLRLSGTKFGCGVAYCGACTVHLDGQPVRSCSVAVGDAAGKRVTTSEGVSGPVIDALRAAWAAEITG